MDAPREKENSQLQRRHTFMRIIPLVLLPLFMLFLAVVAFAIIQLGMGKSLPQIGTQLGTLWQTGKSYLIIPTNIIGALILLSALWKNRGQIKKMLSRQ